MGGRAGTLTRPLQIDGLQIGDCRLQIDGLQIGDCRSTDCRLVIGTRGQAGKREAGSRKQEAGSG
jgi:hypothetical protein